MSAAVSSRDREKIAAKSRRKPPHLTEPYEKPEGEPDGFRLPPPEASNRSKPQPRRADDRDEESEE